MSAMERAEAETLKPPVRRLSDSVSAEIEARRAAGACTQCGVTTCLGSGKGNQCTARCEIIKHPKEWV